MKEVLKKLRALETEMEEAENQSEYWMEEEHLDMEKSDNYEAEADRLYQEVYKMHNQVADFIVNLTSGQIDTNNCPWAMEFIKQHGFGQATGRMVRSGYCTYPVVKLDIEKIGEYLEVA